MAVSHTTTDSEVESLGRPEPDFQHGNQGSCWVVLGLNSGLHNWDYSAFRATFLFIFPYWTHLFLFFTVVG